MPFDVACTLEYALPLPVTALFNIRPAATRQQRILDEALVLTPAVAVESMTIEPTGNRLDRILLPQGTVRLDYRARVELDAHRFDPAAVAECAPSALPMDVLGELMPSRYCQADRLAHLAQKLFADLAPGHERVTAICNWIHENVDYRAGSSDAHTSALDTLTDRAGVCRDFAHVGIGLCRALGIPARFASSYAFGLDPPDFHAVFEAWLGDRWYLFDPTRQAALDGIVRIGVGRDAAEVAFANFWGGSVELLDMQVSIVRSDGAGEIGERTTDAVSVAST